MAEHADEWNVTRVTVEEYAAKCRVLEQHCRAVGRDPAAIRRSRMVWVIAGRPADLDARLARSRAVFPRLPRTPPPGARPDSSTALEDVRRDLVRWHAVGSGRVMLQVLDMTDLDMIALMGRELRL